MCRPVKFKKGDRVGEQQILMITDSWIPEGKDMRYRTSIFECPFCGKHFEGFLNYVNRKNLKENYSCGCQHDNPKHLKGDYVGEHKVLILEDYPTVKIDGKKKERKFKFECKHCGKPFICDIKQVKNGRTSCGCTLRKQQLVEGQYLNGFKVIKPNHKMSLNSKKYFSIFECKHCKTHFEVLNFSIRNGYTNSCGCQTSASKGEIALSDWIQSIYPNEAIRNNARILNLKEVDVLVESQGIGFEYNGLYWHSQSRGKDQSYHINKVNIAKQKGIKLFHIFEHDWKHREEITKDTLLRCLDLIKPNVKSQQCTLKSITQKEAKDFVKANSLYPYKSSEINLGLFNMNELVSLMSFQKDTNEDYLIQNVTTKIGINVESGYKTIIDTFEAEYKPNNLIWLSDNSLSLDYIIKDLDFIFSKREIAKKHYFNPSNLEVITEQKIKHLMKDNTCGESEFYFLSELGYLRYWDCGNDVYIKTKGNK